MISKRFVTTTGRYLDLNNQKKYRTCARLALTLPLTLNSQQPIQNICDSISQSLDYEFIKDFNKLDEICNIGIKGFPEN